MLAKSIIAGTVLSLMAGGVVYFGTDIDASELKDKVVSKTAELKTDISDKVMTGNEEHPRGPKSDAPKEKSSVNIPSVKTPSGKLIDAKKPTVTYSSESERKEAVVTQDSELTTDPSKPQKKWLNQYLKKEPAKTPKSRKIKTAEVVSPEPTAKEQMEDKVKIAPKHSYGSESGASRKKTAKFIVEDKAEGENPETGRKKATRKMLHDIIKKDRAMFIGKGSDGTEKKVEVKVIANEDGETTIETETIDMGDGKIMKIVKKTMKTEEGSAKDSKKMRIKVMTDEDGMDDMGAKDIKVIMMDVDKTTSKDISGTVKIIMAQAEKIKLPELRDRAYLDLVSYGLDNGDYEVAGNALAEIKQVELRDTARNRIAVAHAKDGHAKQAFAVLDDIEVDSLRDVMRLQVIEALTTPDELPEDMQ